MARMPTSTNQSTPMNPWRVLWLLITGALVLELQPLMGATFALAPKNELKVTLSGPSKAPQGTFVEGGAKVTYNGRCGSDGSCTTAKLKGFVEVRGPNGYYFKGPSESKTLKSGQSGNFTRKWRTPRKPGVYTVTVQITGNDDDATNLKFVKSSKLTVE